MHLNRLILNHITVKSSVQQPNRLSLSQLRYQHLYPHMSQRNLLLKEISFGKQLQIGPAVGEGVGLVDGDIVGFEVGEVEGEGVG